MPTHRIAATAFIPAPPQDLYAIIADYHQAHPQILPKPPFVSLAVEQGGTGSGTVLRIQMRVLGQLQTCHAVVTEPIPGRVLVETNDNGSVRCNPLHVMEYQNLDYCTSAIEVEITQLHSPDFLGTRSCAHRAGWRSGATW